MRLFIGEDEKERERDMVKAEMIPLSATTLTFWDKFYELQYKMFFNNQENVQNHMYSSEPIEWPLTGRGIAYWVSTEHNVCELLNKIICMRYIYCIKYISSHFTYI